MKYLIIFFIIIFIVIIFLAILKVLINLNYKNKIIDEKVSFDDSIIYFEEDINEDDEEPNSNN